MEIKEIEDFDSDNLAGMTKYLENIDGGLTDAKTERIIIFEWAEYGTLKEKYEIDWPWKLIPYNNHNQQQIMEYATVDGREQLDFGLNLTPVQQEFGNVIKAAWQGEPLDRLEIKNLFNTLDESSQAKKDDLMPEIFNYTIDTLPYEPLLSLKKGYYLFECINGEIDKEKGINLLKESVDASIKDAQLRYAFALRENESFVKMNL
ncbi:hypothetical protein C1646_757148 [Rhizophagus diaphanus]|nr:hypothetical protein C1646_757148 [Rhizophagus diaphanus] [Rhizophagus sp. MUCL 43196]